MTEPSKTFSLAEVEGFLAAERERCAKVCDHRSAECRAAADDTRPGRVQAFILSEAAKASSLAVAIRNLAPEPMGGEV